MKKSELYGYIGTVISGIIILLLLFFVLLPGLKNIEDDGVMISFGDAFDGAGSSEKPADQNPQTSSPKSEVKEEMITQTEKSVVINNTKKPKETTQPKADDRLVKEQQASQQADDLIGGSFGSGGTTGSGNTEGNQTTGNPVGSGSSGGNSWSLNGRNLLGKMPTPDYNQNVEGFVIVEIKVDASGTVISASVAKYTVSDPSLRNAAVNAAKRTRFSSGSGTVVGSIKYNFKLR
jgi:TonB family protein